MAPPYSSDYYLASAMDTQRSISDFHLGDLIFRGEQADIFSARFTQAGGVIQSAVIKILKPKLSCIGHELRSFLSEVSWASELCSSILPHVFQAGEHKGHYFLAMEHVEGWTLGGFTQALRINTTTLPCEVALSIMMQLASGLHEIHEHLEDGKRLGVVHLGLTPANIMLSHGGQAVLLDFGSTIAVAAGERPTSPTSIGEYQAPEVQVSESVIDQRADVFSLGKLFEDLLHHVLPSEIGDDLPVLVARAVNPDLTKRFPTMDDFRIALDVVAGNRHLSPQPEACATFTQEFFGHEQVNPDPRQHQRVSILAGSGGATAFVERVPAADDEITADGAAPVTGSAAESALATIISAPESKREEFYPPSEPAKLSGNAKPKFINEHLAVTVVGGGVHNTNDDPPAFPDELIATTTFKRKD